MKKLWSEARKAIVALAGLAGEALNAGLVHGSTAHWVSVAIGALTLLGVYATPNTQSADHSLG